MQSCVNNLMEHGAHLFGEILDVERTQTLNQQILSLPLYHTLSDAGQTHLITTLNAFNGATK
ncbi:hypothetical protein [Pseudomonas sp. DSP3-2-2]|uniref:hypothetical protein n=1 Tax=unclassified Pseudomonas TaxID=196821 RepID=UPI003CF6C3B2